LFNRKWDRTLAARSPISDEGSRARQLYVNWLEPARGLQQQGRSITAPIRQQRELGPNQIETGLLKVGQRPGVRDKEQVPGRVERAGPDFGRRDRRRVDARAQLRIAHEMLDAMGMDAFAERARRELSATGETARKRTVTSTDQELTAQEAQVARMARDGLSNPEIGARLFISARTVQYRLSKVFTKLGIASRTQLDGVLPD
jgi:DNA-binding CsgD family transcriptional regulator